MDDDNDDVRLVPVPSSSRTTAAKSSKPRNVGINITDMMLSLPVGLSARTGLLGGGQQKKPQGTPIAVPTSERRPSSLSMGSTQHTLMTGIRDGGPSSRRKSTTTLHGGFSPPFSPKSIPAPGDYDVVGFVEGYARRGGAKDADHDRSPKSLRLDRHGNNGTRDGAADVVLLSDEDDHHDPKNKRRKMSQDYHLLGPSQATPITVKYKSRTSTMAKSPPTTKSSLLSHSSTTSSSPPNSQSRVRHLTTSSSPITPEKMFAMGPGTFPQAHILGVLFSNDAGFHSSDMRLQFAPDRLVFFIDKVATRIPHSDLKTVEFNMHSDIKVLLIETKCPLDPSSNLALHYNPEPHSGKARQLKVLCKFENAQLTKVLKELSPKGVAVKPLTSDKAHNLLDAYRNLAGLDNDENQPETKVENSKIETAMVATSSPTRITRSSRRLSRSKADALLFTYPFSGGPKSITIHESDVARLEPEQFLNDTIIEFCLRIIQNNLEKSDPTLANQVHVFNSFFYELLSERDGSSPISYNKIKKWTSKVDLFSKKYILVPVHESAHWYLAIITNPGLLLTPNGDNSPARIRSTETAESPKEVASTASPLGSLPESPESDIVHEKSSPPPKKLPLYGTRSQSKPEIDPSAKPYIVVLDSLDLKHPHVFSNLRSYLQHELEAKKGVSMKVTNSEIVGKYAKWPRQGNHCDCGVFLLHYAKTFLEDPEKMLWSIVNSVNSENMWSDDEITKLRDRYKDDMRAIKVKYDVFQTEKQVTESTNINNTTTMMAATASKATESSSSSSSSLTSMTKRQSQPSHSSTSPSSSSTPSSASPSTMASQCRTTSIHLTQQQPKSGHESGEDSAPESAHITTTSKRRKLNDSDDAVNPVEIDMDEDNERKGGHNDVKTETKVWRKNGGTMEL